MPFSAGTFTRTTGVQTGPKAWQQTEAAGRDILSLDEDVHDEDLARAVNNSLQKNGDNYATANIPMANHKFTGLSPGSAAGDSVRYEQVIGVPSTAINGGFVTAVGGASLVVSVKFADGTPAGQDPAADRPVFFNFRSVDPTSGSGITRTAIAPLSLTVPLGATLGVPALPATTLAPTRVYVVIIDDSGTLRLGVIQGPIATSLDESQLITTTLVDTSADLADVVYSNLTIVTGRAFRVIGIIDFAAGMTAGTWTPPVSVATGSTGTEVPRKSPAGLLHGMELLARGRTLANDADIRMTLPQGYTGYKIYVTGLIPTIDAQNLWMRFQKSGAGAPDAGATDYDWGVQSIRVDGTIQNTGSIGSLAMVINGGTAPNVGNLVTEGVDAEIILVGVKSATRWARAFWTGFFIDSGGTPRGCSFVGGGSRRTVQDVDRVQLLFGTGTMKADGEWLLYGI